MATQTLTTFDALLKNVYRGPIVELLNHETYLLDQLSKQNVNDMGSFNGRQMIFPVHVSRNRGRGATTDGGTLATAGKQGYLDGIVPIRYFDQGIEITDMVIKQSQNDEGAFVRALSSEMDGAMMDMKKDISRMMYGTGDGVLANCTATQSSTTISVDSGQYIAVGDTVDVLTASNGTVKGSGLTVTAVTYTGTASSATQANANITQTATGAPQITYANLRAPLAQVEKGDYFDPAGLVVIAHPVFADVLRSVVDANGRPIFNESSNGTAGGGQGGVPTLFNHPLHWSLGAKTSANPSATPTGNPLLIVASANYMLVGNREPLSVQNIDGNTGLGALSDTAYLKMRARKAFAVGHENAFAILEWRQ